MQSVATLLTDEDFMTTPTPAGQYLHLRFTGSGSEYFRIWIVNLLLTIVTLGLYLPWAKARRLRYFHGNTLVGGHPMGFHGEPIQMLKGSLLVAAFLLAYVFVGGVSPGLQALMTLAALAAMPALMRSALRFRLTHTSWRGLRFGFSGTMAQAYRSHWPILAAFAGVVALTIVASAAVSGTSRANHLEGVPFAAVLSLSMLIMLGVVPLWWHRQARYRMEHANFAGVGVRMKAGAGEFYGALVGTAGVSMLATVPAVLVICVMPLTAATSDDPGLQQMLTPQALQSTAWWTAAILAFCYLLAVCAGKAYHASRMQNVVWGSAEGDQIRLQSRLGFLPTLTLYMKNGLLTVLSLGLYWPFAQVALARLRLEAVSAELFTDVDALVSGQRGGSAHATGDAGVDAFGIDVGL